MVKIAFILNSLEIGGIGSVASLLANGISLNNKIEIDLILLHDKQKFFEVDDKVKIISNPYKREFQKKMIYAFKTFNFLRKTISNGKYDRIVVHGEWITSFVSFSLLGVRRPPIYFYDHSNPLRKGQHPFQALMKWTYGRADGIIVLSQKAKEVIFAKSKNKNIIVIDNIVELHQLPPINISKKQQAIYLGRLSREKGPDVLLRAISKLNDKTFKFLFIGDGELKEELIELTNSLGINNRVEFVGRAKPKQFLHESSIFILPSHTENFPLALIEAMSIGLSVIMTDCISWRGDDQFIEHMKNGKIVPKNNPQALAKAIDYLIEHEDFREQIGKEALKIRERFDEDRIVKDFLKAINIYV
jgi:GalNAc-alpha-(1->4)-GalNAc-alpha-(1->3)-diNAcBac-PP-undecaprenol alpha-1,4-N-acetyl-D-galactosaminyltransferase